MDNSKQLKFYIPALDDWTEDEINVAIKKGCPPTGAFFAYLTAARLGDISGSTEFDRGVAEGIRLGFRDIQDRVLTGKTELEIKTDGKI